MSYESTLGWYAKNDPRDFDNLIRLIQEEKARGGAYKAKAEVEERPAIQGLPLEGKNVCLVVGHEPGGGAKGERVWNTKVAKILAKKLEAKGCEVFIYMHRTRAYTQRCREMRAGVKKHMPDADCVLLMHYNSVDYPGAEGHEFHYYGVRSFASELRDSWQKKFPWSRARQDNGILQNRNGRGSKMLKFAPAPACLTEPFFNSNPKELAALNDAHEEVADCYDEAITNFLLS